MLTACWMTGCRLGKLHHEVTKKEDKAVAYFKQGLVLANSLHPIPMRKAWYQVSPLQRSHMIPRKEAVEWM